MLIKKIFKCFRFTFIYNIHTYFYVFIYITVEQRLQRFDIITEYLGFKPRHVFGVHGKWFLYVHLPTLCMQGKCFNLYTPPITSWYSAQWICICILSIFWLQLRFRIEFRCRDLVCKSDCLLNPYYSLYNTSKLPSNSFFFFLTDLLHHLAQNLHFKHWSSRWRISVLQYIIPSFFWWILKIIHISQRHIKVIAIFVYLVFPVRPYDVAKN